MDTAIWIALISALGVIGSAFIQWRSNRATVRAAEKRELAEREDRDKQLAADREHQRLMAIEADERATVLKKWEAQRALNEAWRPRRVLAHETALRAIDAYKRAIDKGTMAFYSAELMHQPAQREESSSIEDRDDFFGAVPEVDTFGSEASSLRLHEVEKAFFELERFLTMNSWDGQIITESVLKRMDPYVDALESAIKEYRKAAKTDLGTMD